MKEKIALRANNSILVESVFHGAKDEAKPAGSEQRAAILTTDYKTASSKKSTPPRGFSKFRISYCILLTAICPTSFPWRLGLPARLPPRRGYAPEGRAYSLEGAIHIVKVILFNIQSLRIY